MKVVSDFLLLWALKRVEARSAPQVIGIDPKRNYFAAYFSRNDSVSDRYLFEKLVGDTVECLAWGKEGFSRKEKINLNLVDKENIEIYHWFRSVTTITTGLQAFCISQFLCKSFFFNLKEKIAQKAFNQRFRLREERQEVLKSIVEKSMDAAISNRNGHPFRENKSALGWFFEIHGDRAAQHPSFDEHSLRFRAIIDSLVTSGDLVKSGNRVQVSGQALKSLADFELEERRHRDQLSTNRRIASLTGVLAIIAVVEILVSVVSKQ